MKLLFRHILRTICKSPLQPLLILLTVAISVAASVTSLRMRDMISDHADEIASLEVELGDILVTVRGDAKVRMLFANDAECVIGDTGDVFGEYALTAFWKHGDGVRVVSASAVDLVAADRYFDFEYEAMGEFTTSNLHTSVVISDDFARENGLTLGSTVNLEILGVDTPYKVQAIAKTHGVLEERDILISSTSLVKLLSNWIPMMSAYPAEIFPCNRLMIRLDEDADVGEIQQLLQSSDPFRNQSVKLTFDAGERDFIVYTQQMGITVMASLVVLLAVILIATCLQLLQKQRSDEYALFCLVGTTRHTLWNMQLAEALLYALCGSAIGLLLSQPMITMESEAFVWLEGGVYLRASDAVIGVLMAVVLMLICTTVSIFKQKRYSMTEWLGQTNDLSPSKKRVLPFAIFALASGIFVLTSYLIPVKYRAIPGFAATFLCVGTLFCLVPLCVDWIAAFLEKQLEKRQRMGSCLTVAVKSLRNHASLLHVARLFSVLVAVLIVISTCANTMERQVGLMEQAITADLVAVNASDEMYEKLRSDPNVEGVAGVEFFPSVQIGDQAVTIGLSVSGDVHSCMVSEMLPTRLPIGNEVILSEGLAMLLELDIGDPVTVEFQGVEYRFVLSDMVPMTLDALFFNAKDMGMLQNEMLCVSMKETTQVDAFSDVTAMLESDGAVMIAPQSLFLTMPQTMAGFVFLLRSSVLIAATLAFVGCVNVLYAQYKGRATERKQLRAVGMTRRQMIWMHLLELLPIVVVSLLLATVFGGVICLIVDGIAHSFGIVMFA